LAQKLADAFTQKTGIKVKIESEGCVTGIYKASESKVDIELSTLEVNKDSLSIGTTVKIFAKAPTVLLVNKNNPVNNLTLNQVKDIISGKIKNW